jgi:hypothetical protein
MIDGLERILSEIDARFVEWGAAGAGNTSGLAPSVAAEIECGPLAPVIDLATGERVA